ncbi:MAG: hypothetical protein ACXAEU_25965, partial [Candidatus Hodarchaeales archaeon]
MKKEHENQEYEDNLIKQETRDTSTGNVLDNDNTDSIVRDLKDFIISHFRSFEYSVESLNQKTDFLQLGMSELRDKLNYLLVSSAISTTKNIVFTPDFVKFVVDKTSDITEEEVLAVMGSHTMGIVVSFFHQTDGPIPIIVFPNNLKENPNLLISVADRSFSSGQFLEDHINESTSNFEISLGEGFFVNCISFTFALDRPQTRDGFEHVTVNILINKDVYPLVIQFSESLKDIVHDIHVLMNEIQQDKNKIVKTLLDLRKQVSYLILAYNRTYNYSKMKDL